MPKSREIDKGIVARNKQEEPPYVAVTEADDSLFASSVKTRWLPYGTKVVGSSVEFTLGRANYISLQTAIDESVAGDVIYVLPGIYTESVDVNKDDLHISGWGRSSILNGTMTVSGNYNVLEKMRMNTLTTSGDGNYVVGWLPNAVAPTDSGTGTMMLVTSET